MKKRNKAVKPKKKLVKKEPVQKRIKRIAKYANRDEEIIAPSEWTDSDYDYDEDQDDDQEEDLKLAIRKHELSEEIEDFLAYRPDFVVIEFTNDWVILAKIVNLRINQISNASGFQPLDRTQESKKCLVVLVEYGDEPGRGELAYTLKRGGCPVVNIRTKYDVARKLDEV